MSKVQTASSATTLIDGLTESLSPVRRRQPAKEIVILAGILATQLVGSLALIGGTSAEIFTANMFQITAKALMLGGLALGFAVLAFRSFEPTTSRQRNAALALGGMLVGFGILTLDMGVGATWADTIMPSNGLRCLIASISFALPMFIALTLFMRGAAPTQPRMAALFVGLASGSWGVFVYGLQCPFTSMIYLAIWYGGAVGIVTAGAALALPRVARW